MKPGFIRSLATRSTCAEAYDRVKCSNPIRRNEFGLSGA